jgi:hypothetical protein
MMENSAEVLFQRARKMEKMGLRSAQFILALACATNTTYGMLDSVRNKVAAARSAVAQLYGKYYNYLTDLPNMTFTDVKQRMTGKPTSKEMFGLVEQFLKDGTGFDALMQNIRSGRYDAIINKTQRYIVTQGSPAEDATILDMLLSKLVHADVFGISPGLYSVKHPESLLTFSDFFHPQTTPHLFELIKALFERRANQSAAFIPLYSIQMMIQYYAFIQKALIPENLTEEQKYFLDELEGAINLFYYNNKESIDGDLKERKDGQSYTDFFKREVDEVYIPYDLFKLQDERQNSKNKHTHKRSYQRNEDRFWRIFFEKILPEKRPKLFLGGFFLPEKRQALQILGLPADASKAAIKTQYYKLAREFHPDRMHGKPEKEKLEAQEQFKKIRNAYELLMVK